MKVLVAHGVNMDLLGSREPQIYGHTSLLSLNEKLTNLWKKWTPWDLTIIQTNDEARYLEILSQGWDGCLLNPGAWTHTSLALGDRLAALNLLFIEVHISLPELRGEDVRKTSYLKTHAKGVISGWGTLGYEVALWGLLRLLQGDEGYE